MEMMRPGWLVAVVLVSVVAWASPALAGPAKVYVADEEGDTVTVGKGPNGISVTP